MKKVDYFVESKLLCKKYITFYEVIYILGSKFPLEVITNCLNIEFLFFQRVRRITAKVVKFTHDRTINGNTVFNYLMKDCHGNKIVFAFWGHKNNALVKIGDILEVTNMKVDKYPKIPPHHLFTTDSTKIRVLNDKGTLAAFGNVQDFDGTLKDYTVDTIHEVGCYKSCPDCRKANDEDSKTCKKCKAILTYLIEDFFFKMYLKKDGDYVEVTGFRKSFGEFESLMKNLDMTCGDDVEDWLNSQFEGKVMTIDYTLKNGTQKMIHKIHLDVKPEANEDKADDEEPVKKKAKKGKRN